MLDKHAALLRHQTTRTVLVETGGVEVLRYVLTEEIGRALNPALLRGQAVGGAVQGLGGALLEEIAYDAEGQLLCGTFMDYLMPTTLDVPPIEIVHLETVPLDPVLYRHAASMLEALGWTGLAMVEFRLAPDGPQLMEINGRTHHQDILSQPRLAPAPWAVGGAAELRGAAADGAPEVQDQLRPESACSRH